MKKFLGFHPVLSRTGETAWRWIQFVLGSALFLSLRLDRNRHLFAFIVGYCKFAYPARRSASSLAKAQGVDITEQSVVTLSPRPKRSTSFFGSASFCVCVYDANTRSRVTMLHFVQIYGIGQRTVLCPTAAAITVNSD